MKLLCSSKINLLLLGFVVVVLVSAGRANAEEIEALPR